MFSLSDPFLFPDNPLSHGRGSLSFLGGSVGSVDPLFDQNGEFHWLVGPARRSTLKRTRHVKNSRALTPFCSSSALYFVSGARVDPLLDQNENDHAFVSIVGATQ